MVTLPQMVEASNQKGRCTAYCTEVMTVSNKYILIKDLEKIQIN